MSASTKSANPVPVKSASANLTIPVSIIINDRLRFEIRDESSLNKLSELIERLENIAAIQEGLDDVDAGRTLSLEQFEKKVRESMEYEVHVSNRELADAEEVVERIARQYLRMAARWFVGLLKAIHSLRTFPERCSLAPEADAFQKDIRQHFYGKRQHRYRILFEIRGETVFVLRVLHGARKSLGPNGDPLT